MPRAASILDVVRMCVVCVHVCVPDTFMSLNTALGCIHDAMLAEAPTSGTRSIVILVDACRSQCGQDGLENINGLGFLSGRWVQCGRDTLEDMSRLQGSGFWVAGGCLG